MIYNHEGLFSKLIKIVLQNEGWGTYTNDLTDKGGETKFGISDLRDGKKDGLTDVNGDGVSETKIKELTEQQASNIYKREYFDIFHPELLQNRELILNIFDFAVTSSPVRAIKTLQSIVGVKEDGLMGVITASKVNLYPGNIVGAYKSKRIEFYENIVKKDPTQQKYIKGWTNRVNNLRLV